MQAQEQHTQAQEQHTQAQEQYTQAQQPIIQEPIMEAAMPKQKKVTRCGNCKEPGHKKAKCPMPLVVPEPPPEITVSDINWWGPGVTKKSDNDAANKIRERIVEMIANGRMPDTFTDDAEHGQQWTALAEKIKKFIENTLVTTQHISAYTHYHVKLMAGLTNNYDFDISFLNGTTVVAKRELEFKFGAKSVEDLPQFLSMDAKTDLFDNCYPVYFYNKFLDDYLATDAGLAAVPKPTLTEYLKNIFKTNYDVTPFIALLKSREEIAKPAKDNVVNASFKSYLETHGREIKLDQFKEKLVAQNGKVYMLYEPRTKTFHIEKFEHCKNDFILDKMTIRNGNLLEIPAGDDMRYDMLLRWKNHKGVLKPAWQISLKMLKLIK